MAAVSRWVRFPVAATTQISSSKVGTPGTSRGTANTADSFTIPGSSANQIKVNVDGAGAPAPYELTLSSGTSLDPRFIAKDIQRKLQAYGTVNDGFKYAQVEFSNWSSANGYGQFIIRSGTTGAASSVTVTNGSSSVLSTIGMNTLGEAAGTVNHLGTSTANGAYGGTVTTSGTYQGAFDDVYHVVIAGAAMIGTVAYGGGNTYGVGNAGVAAAAGDWNYDSNNTYVLTVDTTNGSTMGGGTGNVPTFTVAMSVGSGDTVATAQEILFSDVYYAIGTRGLYLKFTDYPFGNSDTVTVPLTASVTGGGSVATAEYVIHSRCGDNNSTPTLTSASPTDVGTKGVTVSFTSGTLAAKDEWRTFCQSPTPEAYGVTSMDYGNVTVTTDSAVKVHQFEITSGAVAMSNVKFSLQNNGTFSHHEAGNSDTLFHFGVVGAGNRGDGGGGAGTGPEWPPVTITAADISQDKAGGSTGAPVNLYSSKDNLSVVASADNAEVVGNEGLAADFVFTAIKLGSDETGANSTINYRCYFDYSS